MKAVAWILLVLLLGAPIAIALWWVFPLAGGVCIWLLFRYGGAQRAGRFLKPILIVLLLLFVLWLWFVPRRHLVGRSYETNISAGLVRRIVSPSAQPSPELQRSALERRRLLEALGRERLKIADIASVLDLQDSADAVFVTRNKNGLSDDAGLGNTLTSLRNELTSHKQDDGSSTPDLLVLAALKNLVQQATSVLDKAQTEALGTEITADQISEERNQLPRLLSSYRIDSLYTQVANVQNALRHTLNVNLSPESSYYFKYDRSTDTLSSEQRTLINLGGQQPVSIDVSALLAGVQDPSLKEQISVRENLSAERELGASEHQIPLHPETKELTVRRRISESSASYQLVTDHGWVPFRGVRLRWPIPLDSSVVLSLRFPEDPSTNWPLTVPIRTGAGDAIEALFLPRYSFFYADAGLKSALASESNADTDELVPDQATPKITDLALDKTIQVELLPRYLSNFVGQKYKQYLVIENLVVCLVIAAVSALCVAIVSS